MIRKILAAAAALMMGLVALVAVAPAASAQYGNGCSRAEFKKIDRGMSVRKVKNIVDTKVNKKEYAGGGYALYTFRDRWYQPVCIVAFKNGRAGGIPGWKQFIG